MRLQPIELLAPAADLAVGRAAIDAGADAVYIGGPAFGARAAACNSMDDIAALCEYAHRFGARVFLTLNTLIYDNERSQVERIAWQAYEVGVDALIVQDMSILDLRLPPIALHASTQCYNATVAQVVALQDAGFERVVLERALSIAEIKEICDATTVEIEMFIHGAICVGYSGRCTLSEHLTGRSGNRGECAQPCRSKYDLVDSTGRVLIGDKALLSPRDMNLSARIGQIVDAGVRSLKIEGRLKDASYVTNIVAHYNRILIEEGVQRTSQGRSIPNFEPNPALSFNRGFTEWFFDGPRDGVSAVAGQSGELVGTVCRVGDKYFEIDTDVAPIGKVEKAVKVELANGDGITFVGGGVRVNRVDGERVFPLSMQNIAVGMAIFRNFSVAFAPWARRVIDVDLVLTDSELIATDNYGFRSVVALPANLEVAKNEDKARQTILTALSRSGDTYFVVRNVDIECKNVPFMPISELNSLRRELLDGMAVNRTVRVDTITSRPELTPDNHNYLMRSRYCILRERGVCLKNNQSFKPPLYLVNNKQRIELNFHCATCEMELI